MKKEKLIRPIKIGSIKLKNNLLLAPMVDVTDSAFRQLCLSQGCALTFTPMIYTSQLIYKNVKTQKVIKFKEKERPIGIQITGDKIEEYKKILPVLKEYDIIDLNCGCPSHKLIKSKAGSYLLKDPKKIAEIVSFLKSSLPSKTITVKIRLGFKTNKALKIAKAVESAGADALTIHARLATQSNKTPADWLQIKKIKSALSIPVIGNGDIFKPEDAIKMLKQTGCDGVMIARSAMTNPKIFKQILDLETNGFYKENTMKDKIKIFKSYIELAESSDCFDLSRAKYIGTSFLSGFPGASKARADFVRLKTLKEIKSFLNMLVKSL